MGTIPLSDMKQNSHMIAYVWGQGLKDSKGSLRTTTSAEKSRGWAEQY